MLLFRQVLKNFLTYSFGAIILRLITASISFISINFLLPEEFGLLSLINTFIWIAPIFLSLGLRQAYGIDFFHTENNGRKKILNDIILIYLIFSIPILVSCILNMNLINKYIFFNQLNKQILITIFLICFIHFFTELLFLTYRYQLKAIHFTLTQILMGIITAFCTMILIIFFNLKILAIVLSNFIGMACITIFGLTQYLKKIGKLNFDILQDKQKIKYYFKLGLPFIPNLIFYWILTFSDRWLLAKYSTMENVGIYSLADSFAQLFQMVIAYPLTSAYVPHIFNLFNQNKDNILEINTWNNKNMFYTMSLLLLIVFIGFFTCKNLFYFIFPEKYHQAADYILILLIGQVFLIGTNFASCYMQFIKKTYFLLTFTIFSALINVFLNIWLIPQFSIYGCAFATLISYFIYFFISFIVTKILITKHFFNLYPQTIVKT